MGVSRPTATIVSVSILLLLSACKGAPQRGAPPPPEVAVVSVTPHDVPVTYEFSGQVIPYRRVEVRSRVDGIILERPFAEGQLVKPGDVLYRIDPVRYEATFHSAQARYENAKQLLDRLEPLVTQHAVAQQDVDNARSQLTAAQAALDQAKKDFDETTVRAEIEGRVGRTEMEVGARVTGPANLLTVIDRLDPVYVSFRPSSEQLLDWNSDPSSRALIQPGSRLDVEVTLPDGRTLPRSGKLYFVAPSMDPTTGTQEFRATFPNHDHVLIPGTFVRVKLVGFARGKALAVPQRAVQTALGRQFVLVVGSGDSVSARDVIPGPWSGNLWIINQGLQPGDRVIVDGVQKAIPGRTVRPVALADSAVATAAPAANQASTRSGR